jgi:hypothetical protein
LLLNIVNIPSKPGLPSSTYISNSILEIVVIFKIFNWKKHIFPSFSPKKKHKTKQKNSKKLPPQKISLQISNGTFPRLNIASKRSHSRS